MTVPLFGRVKGNLTSQRTMYPEIYDFGHLKVCLVLPTSGIDTQ